jgi:hypothetical protein
LEVGHLFLVCVIRGNDPKIVLAEPVLAIGLSVILRHIAAHYFF